MKPQSLLLGADGGIGCPGCGVTLHPVWPNGRSGTYELRHADDCEQFKTVPLGNLPEQIQKMAMGLRDIASELENRQPLAGPSDYGTGLDAAREIVDIVQGHEADDDDGEAVTRAVLEALANLERAWRPVRTVSYGDNPHAQLAEQRKALDHLLGELHELATRLLGSQHRRRREAGEELAKTLNSAILRLVDVTRPMECPEHGWQGGMIPCQHSSHGTPLYGYGIPQDSQGAYIAEPDEPVLHQPGRCPRCGIVHSVGQAASLNISEGLVTPWK